MERPISVQPDCQEFLNRHSEYRDDRLGEADLALMKAHMVSCPSCCRYDRVLDAGVAILRDTEAGRSGEGLELAGIQRQVRILERRESAALGAVGSGMSAAAAVGVAVLLGVVAWSPFLFDNPPEVEIEPVVAGAPLPASAPGFFPPSAAQSHSFMALPEEEAARARSMLLKYGRNRARVTARNAESALEPD